MARFAYGGQALMEGVLMRGKDAIGVAVRGPEGQIFGAQEPLNSVLHRNRFARAPFFRGVVVLYETLVIGTRWLMRSGSLAAAGEGVAMGGRAVALTFAFTIIFALGLFVVVPLLAAQGATNAMVNGGSALIQHLIEACIRIAIFVGYLLLVSRSPDIRRVFQYHGAEHMTIHTLEHELPLTVDNARRYPTAHPRCGTEFLVVFIIVSILLFSLLAGQSLLVSIVGRILLIPVVAAIAYEVLRWGAKRRDSWAVRWLFLPGIWLQAITTKQPDDDMIEVAIASMHEALAANGETAPEGSWEPERVAMPNAQDLARDVEARQHDAPAESPVDPDPRSRGVQRVRVMSLEQRLDDVERRLEHIEQEWSDPAVAADPDRSRELGREQARLAPIVDGYRRLRGIRAQLATSRHERETEQDPELREMARQIVAELELEESAILADLRLALLPVDPNDDRDVIVEIRAGAGGEEAALFAAELARMYMRYAERHRWSVEVLSTNETGIGGLREIFFQVRAEGAWSRLKFEGGVHRVQRVPETESGGRIHTSTATVAVLPEADEVDVHIDEERDLRIDVKRASGPGGQSVNTTDSAVRITHLPTGLVVEIQDEKSQHKNKAKALAVLRARLLEQEQRKAHEEEAAVRRGMVGSGDRSEKIRTYNFPQDRLTDHRIGLDLHNLPNVMDGDLDRLIDALITTDQARRLAEDDASGAAA